MSSKIVFDICFFQKDSMKVNMDQNDLYIFS